MRMIHSGVPDFDLTPNRIDLRFSGCFARPQTPARVGSSRWSSEHSRREPTQHRVRLVGAISATYRDELIAHARELGVADRVQILDHTTTPEKQISWANVVLTCSDAEAFGRATVEALKSGSRSSAREVGYS